MRRWIAVTLLLCSWLSLLATKSSFAQEQVESKRKVATRVIPVYPNTARNMNLRGTVKVEALVAASGMVKSIEVKGGHPLFAQAAQDAVRHWKWEPAAHETRELVEINFNPH